ncbi:MAG: Bifunctional protein FolD [Candidatus Moranbacteria bacterium GW2011_GWE1_36_7]|nr:MAG: Bifunctional protein FolD [Candidatus Moranbacteria bacterium GW2011_GWD2_36_12]KKQ06146.1 MAG: Bifunctional protein FolD [Candidatus Moranbacteria bacterium GW2011_GWE2_36_40]KKQ15152.1 MAG: Bifunctional protein FolD [Candidatus Moranbacteria bacterium GW2011_GWE1_36_7]
MKLLYGKSVAEEILSRLKNDILMQSQKPELAVILVGNDEASQLYVNLKERKAKEIGMNFVRYDFSEDVSENDILVQIEKLNADVNVNGIIVQLPLPKKFDTQKIISSIDLKKDVDGFSAQSGSAFGGHPGTAPVFPRAIMKLIESSEQSIPGKKAIVIVNSELFGQVMIEILNQKGAITQYVLAENISSKLKEIKGADIVVSAVGSPGLLKGQMLKDGSIIIDGGIEKVGEKVFGDVNFASTEALSGYITPVPGGVGPLTIACLLENTFLAFEAQQKEN